MQRLLEADIACAPSAPALINARVFASAACDASGRVVAADEQLRPWLEARGGLHVDLAALGSSTSGVTLLIEDHGRVVAVAAAHWPKARSWPLAGNVRASLEAGEAVIALVARAAAPRQSGLPRAAAALQLNGLEARVTRALIEQGCARSAARAAGVSYETARSVLKGAMRKAGTVRQSAYVSTCMQIETGEASQGQASQVLRDLFGLSARQARVAMLVAQGASREQTAQSLGVSDSVVKADLKTVFTACAVDSSAALGRVVAQVNALNALSTAVTVDVELAEREPLRLAPRAGRMGRIAFADHGPEEGAATLFLHSGTTGRHLPEPYVVHLQGLGLRPITLDRPGYGLTTPLTGDYLDGAADDLADIADLLGLEKVNVICRSGAIVVAHFARRHSHRLSRAVLINPEPPSSNDSRYAGILGGLKRLIVSHPGALEAFLRTLSRRAAPHSILQVVRAAVRSSPADLAMLDDPAFAKGFVHASQQAALQDGVGLVAMERVVSRACLMANDIPGQARFTILCGAQDPLQASDEALSWWREALPGAHWALVDDAGRFLHAQRPDLLAAALKG
jgi:pimeloyl-ACP methyl ester carboxylesterase/DNA-binding CsgD family transcriptional regulator